MFTMQVMMASLQKEGKFQYNERLMISLVSHIAYFMNVTRGPEQLRLPAYGKIQRIVHYLLLQFTVNIFLVPSNFPSNNIALTMGFQKPVSALTG